MGSLITEHITRPLESSEITEIPGDGAKVLQWYMQAWANKLLKPTDEVLRTFRLQIYETIMNDWGCNIIKYKIVW